MQHVHYAVAIAFTNDYIVFATFCCACCLFVLQHTHHRFLHLLMTVIMLQTHLFFHSLMTVMLHLIFCILINWLNANIMSLLHWIKHAAAAAVVSSNSSCILPFYCQQLLYVLGVCVLVIENLVW